MSGRQSQSTGTGNGPVHTDTEAKPKRKRAAFTRTARPVYLVMQVLGEDGNPVSFNKSHLKVLTVERSADKVLEAVEAGKYPNSFYVRVVIPVTPVKPAATPAAA